MSSENRFYIYNLTDVELSLSQMEFYDAKKAFAEEPLQFAKFRLARQKAWCNTSESNTKAIISRHI